MSLGGFHLSQFKITYDPELHLFLNDYGMDLLFHYANSILEASQLSDGNWSIDNDKIAGADQIVSGLPIYDIKSRIPVWGTAYPEDSYNIGCFLKYNNGNIVRYLFIMINSSVMYFDALPGSQELEQNSLKFLRVVTTHEPSSGYYSKYGGMPISIGAMCSSQPFNISDLCDNTKDVFTVSDTPLFPVNGCFIHSFKYNDYSSNLPFSYRKLSNPNPNDSYVFGICVKNDIIISIFRDCSWTTGDYTCSIFGNIINCYNNSDTKKFGVIQGSCSFYKDWTNNSNCIETYNNNSYNVACGCFKTSDTSVGLIKEYLSTVISHTSDARTFCACTGSYLSFYDDIANTDSGSRYKGVIDTDVFRQCNVLTGSEVVLDGNFIRIGSCIVGWDSSNASLLE